MKKSFKIKTRKIQKGLVEVRYGEEWNEYKILIPSKARIFKRRLRKEKKI
jgi:hypothetical protein